MKENIKLVPQYFPVGYEKRNCKAPKRKRSYGKCENIGEVSRWLDHYSGGV
jgi:hypothetical protein